jgi:phosphatidylglycerophosphatase A
VAIPIFWLLAIVIPPLFVAFLAIPLFFVGVWAADRTGRDLGKVDHGAIVIDEIVAFLPLAAVSSASLLLQALAFLLFRLFDVWKPFPIRELERRIPGGMGVMIDDVAAAAYAYFFFLLFVVFVYKGLGIE